MRGAILAVLLVSAPVLYPQSSEVMMARLKKAQAYSSEGFNPISCFAGQVKIEKKPLSGQPFSVFAPEQDKRCCGTLLKSAQTDQHGHFLVEPLSEGKYFAQFKSNGSVDLISFAVVDSYARCDGTHLEINFSKTGESTVRDYVDINDSGQDCLEYRLQCYRK